GFSCAHSLCRCVASVICVRLLSSCSRPHLDLHSFPTRRSSDLCPHAGAAARILRYFETAAEFFRSFPHSSYAVTTVDALVLSIRDRKSTRLNSSHEWISYAVFCLKKTNNTNARATRSRHTHSIK